MNQQEFVKGESSSVNPYNNELLCSDCQFCIRIRRLTWPTPRIVGLAPSFPLTPQDISKPNIYTALIFIRYITNRLFELILRRQMTNSRIVLSRGTMLASFVQLPLLQKAFVVSVGNTFMVSAVRGTEVVRYKK
jgi:hypothetical protein